MKKVKDEIDDFQYTDTHGVAWVYSTKDVETPKSFNFMHLTCNQCGKGYDEFIRDIHDGSPCYYFWEGIRPLSPQEMISAMQGSIDITWFCSCQCSEEFVKDLHEKE